MMKRILVLVLTLTIIAVGASAQRKTDRLDRGLVAVATGDTTIHVSWRRLATEYYDVTYNLYKDGARIAENLTTTSFADCNGLTSSYQVAAVVKNVEQAKCDATTVWAGWQKYISGYQGGYMDIPLAAVYDRNGNDVTTHYEPNDAEFADLDGDGELEMIIKRLNTEDANNVYPQSNTTEFVVLDAYDINWKSGGASLMWRIDCGPNMVSLNSTEINIIAFDWDEDGKAEVVLRGADNMIVYGSNGRNRLYTIGDMNVNTRNTFNPANGAQFAWTHTGAEYLIYMNGETGAQYQIINYPLRRLEYYDNLSAEWGGRGYGHNSSKYFFGAPYLDGHTPNLFLARGIYGTHKMIAMSLNKSSHQWSERWRWMCNSEGSAWYGQGYHNFVIADVDEDGRDEIVYGSMVIDDNGKGLHTTGFGHGDAQHVGDFNPYRPGLEFFGCIEDAPYYGSDYRDATTGEVLYKFTSTGDDGRALMDNFTDNYPGCTGRSAGGADISSVTNTLINDPSPALDVQRLNFRIYWDGDLLSEVQDAAGTRNGYIGIDKPGVGRIFNATDIRKENKETIYYNSAISNNDTKHNTCFQGDLIGDWREEFVARVDARTVRVYTTGVASNYSMPSLWLDHQYRQAMVWQMMAYNQPPHLSYFLGELEGYTMAPPPLTTDGRTVIGNNATITNSYNGQHLLHNEYDNTSLTVSGGVPDILTINVPTWVQGHDDNNNITTSTYTCTLSGALSGGTRLVKQGNGILAMANTIHTHTGTTDIWGGTVNFNGTMQNSDVWMNRHTTLNTTDGHFNKALTMEYGATLNIGGASTGTVSSVEIATLTMNYGARVVLDVNGSGENEHDWLNATTLNVDDSKVGVATWENYGPEHIAPVMELRMGATLGNGRYPIGHVSTVNGDLSKVKLVCDAISASFLRLIVDNGVLYLQVSDVATANEPTIVMTEMNSYADNYYLPIVSITANNTDGKTPTLTAKFISLDGTETNVGGEPAETLYSEGFEGSSTASDYWGNGNGGIYSPNYTNSDGQCIGIVSSSDKGDYITFDVDYTDVELYHIDFDAFFNNASKTTDFAVMSKSHVASWVYNWGYNWFTTTESGHNPFLFFIRRGESSTTFTVNETAQTMSLNNSTWYHFTLTVDVQNGTVEYVVTQKGSSSVVSRGVYTLPEGESTECDGFYIRNGRYNYEPGGAGIDNIVISTPESSFNRYTFTEPGTLEVTASLEGYASSTRTFEALCPYVKVNNTGNITIDYFPECSHSESGITTNIAPTPLDINHNDMMYDLQGRKLHNGSVAKGIYILGNKKVVK